METVPIESTMTKEQTQDKVFQLIRISTICMEEDESQTKPSLKDEATVPQIEFLVLIYVILYIPY